MIKIKAPGRVCLFGEHQDYLGLPVIPAAIDKYIYIRAIPNGTTRYKIEMPDIDEERFINVSDQFNHLERRDYFGSGLKVLARQIVLPHTGYDIIIRGDIPVNSGASSSSALITAWIIFLLSISKNQKLISPENLAELAYNAEVKEHGEPGGMMDQYSIAYGQIILVETDDGFNVAKLNSSLNGLVLGDSRTPKETLGLLASVRNHVETAIAQVKSVKPDFNLKSCTVEEFTEIAPYIDIEHRFYLEGTIINHSITKQAIPELQSEKLNLEKIGSLMNKHHRILRDSIRISTPKIDHMIDTALNAGAIGAKINGSGGGGSIVILAPEKQLEVVEALNKLDCAAYPISISDGAGVE